MELTGSREQSKGPGEQTCVENDKCYREKLMRIEIKVAKMEDGGFKPNSV